MSHARRRRTLRCTVLAASLAVLASFVAPAAQAETPPADATTSAGPTSTDPGSIDPGGATDPAGTTEPAPTSAAPESGAAPAGPTDVPLDPAGVASGDTVVGELVQAWPDPTAEEHAHQDAEGHHDGAPLSWIEPAEGDAVRVPTDSLPDVAVGSTLAVTVGDEVVDEASAEQGFEPAVEVQAATVVDAAVPDPTTASAGSAPTNTVTAVLVLPAGATSDGMTIGNVVSTLNGAVSSFWDEQSNGTVRISAVQGAASWVRSTKDCSTPYALWDDVAAQIGWTGGAGKHLMLYVPSNASGCAYGLGTVGSSIGSGGRSYVEASALSVMAHELGHNFGLGHSSELQCNSSLESGTCQTRSYYDFYDVMGISWGQVGTLNTAQAARLGLLPESEQVALTTANAATTVSLAPVAATSGTRVVTLMAPGGRVYYLEYRQASGRDGWLGDSRNAYRLDSGVVLRRGSSGGDTSLLLDGTPSSTSSWDVDRRQALPLGVPVVVGGGNFTVTVGATSATAQITVEPGSTATRGDQACAGPRPRTDRGVGLVDDNGSRRVFVVGGDGAVWTRTGDRDWQSLGGAARYGPAAVTGADGSVHVFVVGTDSAVYGGVLRGGVWSGWSGLGGSATSSPGAAVVDGTIRLFVSGSDGALWSRSSVAGNWTGWGSLGGLTTAAPTASASGRTTVVSVRGVDGRVWSRSIAGDGRAEGWSGGDYAICSTYALPGSQPGGAGPSAAFTDSTGAAWLLNGSAAATSLGGQVSSALSMTTLRGEFAVAGRGSDGALWVYVSGQGWQWWGGNLS